MLLKDPAASAVMGGEPEITMAWQDERTGIWLLSRPDTVSFDGMLSDYKKMATMGEPFTYRTVDQRITRHGYDMQIAFGCEIFERLTANWPMGGIVAQWDQAPHHVILREIAEEDLRIAQFRNRRAIDRFAECLASNHWPGPGDDVGIPPPRWHHASRRNANRRNITMNEQTTQEVVARDRAVTNLPPLTSHRTANSFSRKTAAS